MQEFMEAVETFFAPLKWLSFSNKQKSKYAKYYYLYHACIQLGINVEIPDFMNVQPEVVCERPQDEKIENSLRKVDTLQKNQKPQYKCKQSNFTTDKVAIFENHKKIQTKEDLIKKTRAVRAKSKPPNLLQEKSSETCKDYSGEYKCLLCKRIFTSKKDVTNHLEAIHYKLKKFKCELCCYETARRSSLNRHMYVHSKTKPFQCEFCEYECMRKYQMAQHLVTSHCFSQQLKKIVKK